MKWKCDGGSRKERDLHEKQKIREMFLEDNQPERSKREDTCKHEWGSEEKTDSLNPYYKCNKCDAVL